MKMFIVLVCLMVSSTVHSALAQFEENSWKIAQQSGKYGFIEVTR